jgi:hypothetical protein
LDFLGNPEKYWVYNSLFDESLKEATWLVSRYRDEIRVGDVALIWKACQRSGICAVGEIITDPQEMYDLPESGKYWKFEIDKNRKAVRVLIHYKLKLKLTNTLLGQELRTMPELRSMEIFEQTQGTNFRVSNIQWQVIRNLLKTKYNFES